MKIKPLVSIVCITFNQAKFVEKTLDGFLMQKTKFAFEVIIHDDASTDGTKQIIQKYVEKYPDIIKPVYEKNNQYSTGDYSFINTTYQRSSGKYIAFCEGDDFWIDPDKLQIQVDFMEAHKAYALCFHPVRVFFENNDEPDTIYPAKMNRNDFTLEELLKRNYIQSNSILYRRQRYDNLPSNIIPSDWYMHLYHAQFGKIGFIDRVMSVYRRHEGGIWWNMRSNADLAWTQHGMQHLALFKELLGLFGDTVVYRAIIINHIFYLIDLLIEIDTRSTNQLIRQAIGSSPDTIEVFLLEQRKRGIEVQSELNRINDELIEKKQVEMSLRRELAKRDKELLDIKSSKFWKLIVVYRGVKDRVKKGPHSL